MLALGPGIIGPQPAPVRLAQRATETTDAADGSKEVDAAAIFPISRERPSSSPGPPVASDSRPRANSAPTGRGRSWPFATSTRVARPPSDFVGTYEVRELNLADLESVRTFADQWSGDLDVLINNAGIMMAPAFRTIDDFELHIGTNHLGPFALTNLLLPHITDRVVTVSSVLHRRGRSTWRTCTSTLGPTTR